MIADRYLLEDVIARGGMGAVWSGFDRQERRRVAVKIISLDGVDGVEAGRFKREAEISQQLRGPSFVEVYDHGIVENEAYLVMELLEGETLHERLRRMGTLTTDEAMHLLRSVASCLRLAHTLQIVHRDLKPGNVFFARSKPGKSGVISLDGKAEVVKLFDFGIAKNAWDDARLTRPGMLLGSAFYMSPEQIRSGRDVDARSDLWSLGVILYRALTGSRPFPGAAPEALAHILNDEPPPVRSLNPSLPVGLESFFRKALDKEVLRRFQSIDDMLDAFAAALRGESISDRASDGSSVLAAIERLGASTPPPPPARPRQSTSPTASEQPTVATSTSISLEELHPTEVSGTRVREELPSSTAGVADAPERDSVPSPWSRGVIEPPPRKRRRWPVALLVVALVAFGIILSKSWLLAWARIAGLLP
ncbi:MAG: serine/threonine protein kinase [Myxococcales bacterium]|nr:serine/threonine protein kinase [Myxococcales bacterium]